jgi:hypothetical protein
MTPPHPTQTGRLTALAAVTLLTGILGLIFLVNLRYRDRELAPALNWLIIVSFALFIVVCAAGIFGWLLREHEVWRQAGGPAEGAARARAQAKAEAARALRPQYQDARRVFEGTDDQRSEG